jgi:hypothetical protein
VCHDKPIENEKKKKEKIMQNTKDVAPTNEYRNLAISVLTESPTNPRKRFDEISLQELAASIKSQGLLEPLLVRGNENKKP